MPFMCVGICIVFFRLIYMLREVNFYVFFMEKKFSSGPIIGPLFLLLSLIFACFWCFEAF